jgi:cell division protein YceG involved in septum cleavage
MNQGEIQMRSQKCTKVKAVRQDDGLKKRILICIATIFIIFAACAVFGNIRSSAHGSRSENPVNFKYYTSIEIQPGDTLWDIAKAYITEDYDSVQEYVQTLKEINSLNSDKIKAGQNLIVAYNNTEFVN